MGAFAGRQAQIDTATSGADGHPSLVNQGTSKMVGERGVKHMENEVANE